MIHTLIDGCSYLLDSLSQEPLCKIGRCIQNLGLNISKC